MSKKSGPTYGIDAAPLPALLGAAGLAAAVGGVRRRSARLGLVSAALLSMTGIYLHTTLRGKFRVWERELDRLGLRGDEQLLDMGCGRGAVLIAAAQHLPSGRAVGIDLWTVDQSGNSPQATLANAAKAGVADRVEVRTGDLSSLPFADQSFDVVTAAAAIHNLRSPELRLRAVDEAMRVLRPGGQLLIADPWPFNRRYASHLGQGTVHRLGPNYWYGVPLLAVTSLHVTRAN